MNAEDMTPAQLRELADKLEAKASSKPIKIGFLKWDLYDYRIFKPEFWLITKEQLSGIVRFHLVLHKGTKFDCYVEDNGYDSWYDSIGYGLENMTAEWANQYLENIQPYKGD